MHRKPSIMYLKLRNINKLFSREISKIYAVYSYPKHADQNNVTFH